MSCSFSCLVVPSEIRGPIHETVMNCQRVKLSSGLRCCGLGSWKTELIWSLGRSGSRIGICKMIEMARSAATTPKAAEMPSWSSVEKLSIEITVCDTRRLLYSASSENDVVLGRSMTTKMPAMSLNKKYKYLVLGSSIETHPRHAKQRIRNMERRIKHADPCRDES
jgi:hypothetical protein